jgi:hypothetical protein
MRGPGLDPVEIHDGDPVRIWCSLTPQLAADSSPAFDPVRRSVRETELAISKTGPIGLGNHWRLRTEPLVQLTQRDADGL